MLGNQKKPTAMRRKNLHHTQNLLSERTWEFESPHPHQHNQQLRATEARPLAGHLSVSAVIRP